jgi:hypothetical protein
MFYSSPSTSSPVAYQTKQNYSQTYTGPIKPDTNIARTARGDSMSKAAFAGTPRAFYGQMAPGVRAGSAMANYRAGIQADAEAGKAFAQAQQDQLNRYSNDASSVLQFQERQAGEQGYLRDLLLDRDDVRNRERMAAYKRFANVELDAYQRRVEEAIAQEKRNAMIWSSLL